MKYSEIKTQGVFVSTKTIKGLKLLLKKKKVQPGTFTCITPSGVTHTWEVVPSRIHVCAGSKTKGGKGVNIQMFAATYKGKD